MKNLYTRLVFRAFKTREPITGESLALQRIKQKRNRLIIKNVAVLLALASILLLVITFFVPGLKTHYKFSGDYNTAYIINTCSGCLLGICFVVLIALVSLKNREDNHHSIPDEKNAKKEA
jgi:hypothetical protein